MITASQIEGLRTASDDYLETERLKTLFAQLRVERHPFFLSATEFDEILKWKLRGQYGRQKGRHGLFRHRAIPRLGVGMAVKSANMV